MTQFYERPPGVLPLKLPAGTRTIYGNTFHGEVTLDGAAQVYLGRTSEGGPVLAFHAVSIAWSTVPVPDATPESEEARPDRPIQAGDWVECVRSVGSGGRLTIGERKLVTTVYEMAGDEKVSFDQNDFYWLASRFKRVDGPHQMEAVNPAEELCASCERPAGCCAENCAVRPRECSECHALAALFQADGLCVYCVRRLNDSDEEQRENMDGPRAKPKVRAHTEAALRREAERSRLTADARELAKPHPWEEFE